MTDHANPLLNMSHSVLHHGDLCTLKYIVTHVFFPLKLPDGDDHTVSNDYALARAIASAAHLYCDHLDEVEVHQWDSIAGMLDNLLAVIQFESLDRSRAIAQLRDMDVGDIRTFLIRAQNAAVVFRKQRDVTIFESFEVSPKVEDVMASQGRLICSYPGPAIEIPTVVFDEDGFRSELVNFLIHMNDDVLDAAPTSQKAQSTLIETRDTTHPRYITELLTGILRSVGSAADITRISKHVGDDVVWNNSKLPWRRSSLWLLIKVTLQISLSTLAHDTYKTFMLFFMCCLAEEKTCADLPNDLLQSMSAKISRRLRKLSSSVSMPDWLSRRVLQACISLRSILEKRWKQVQDYRREPLLWAPSQLDLARDIKLSLTNSGDYLQNSVHNHIIDSACSQYDPKHCPRGTLDSFLSSDGAFFEESYRAEPHIALYDVEHAIEQGIDSWVDQVTNNDEACVKLEILADKYSSRALKTYKNNPELLSTMLLTTIELWIALDKMAIKEIPILANYSPEVPTRLLECLLIHRKASFHRLRHAHQYLSCRHSSAKSGWSVFSSTVTADSFSVRFYRMSWHLQRHKAQIEGSAEREVRRKVAELENANAYHAWLQQMSTQIDHDYGVDHYGNQYHADGWCGKCSYEGALRSMQISIQEWPLPASEFHAEAVVFELYCPISFNMWRTATFHLLVDLCSPPNMERKVPYVELREYTALRPHFLQHPRSRITLASDTKPMVATHYNPTSLPTTQEYVCVQNGLNFYGFDSRTCVPVSDAFSRIDISNYCTYQLQAGSYRNLQQYLDTTSHMSNEVVANQVDCHKDLSIHEFLAFGHLRSGSLLQWLNILRELRSRSLSLHRHEVHFLLAQAVSQVGPLADTEWTWHQEIQQATFCGALLEELEKLLQDVEANWLEAVTMDTISFLLRRLLAASPRRAISRKACRLLRAVRGKVFSWMQELSDKLVEAPGDEEFRGFLRDTAAICRNTFDVDPAIVLQLLRTADDINVLLSSAILIHHHTPPNISSLPAYSQLLLDRNQRLSLALEGIIRDAIQADSNEQGINNAVGWVWPHYRPGSKWTPLQGSSSRWISCTTTATANQNSQMVHFNLLDGSLLVDGKPLGRLPSEIQHHSLYGIIFGKQVLEVVPADLPGMDYSARGRISDHQVYFSLRDKDLMIRAIATGSSEIIQLIPPEKLVGDLPVVLIEGHAHWLNLSTSIIEIRHLDTLWKSSPENWRIDCTPGQYRMYRGHECFVDMQSRSWNMVSNLLKPLDIPQNLIVTVSLVDSKQPSLQLSAALPRYGLSFYVDEDGDLQSHNIRGMVYDESQYIGTLFGLINQLVLRPKLRKNVSANELDSRCVLIPEGTIAFRTDGDHVRIEISGGPVLQRVTYQIYKVDTDLGCLAGNPSLTNKLFCAYLHALTSGCGIDPLTGRSGTEEALSLLRSASCWSTMKLTSRDADLLCLIASLCPPRTWYPRHLKHMQKVEWLNLPANSQHHGLYLVSKAIKEHYERIQLFHEGQSKSLFKGFPCLDKYLLGRSARRAAYLFPSEFSEQHLETNLNSDAQYPARDRVNADSGEHRAYTAATVVYRRMANSTTNMDIVLNLLESWSGIVSSNAALSLHYGRSWLAPVLPWVWLEIFNLLRGNDEGKWFQLLFSLPAMVYASPKLCDLVPTFVAIAMDSQFGSENPPQYNSYNLSKGYQPSSITLRSYVSDCAYSFEYSPEFSEPPRREENFQQWRERQIIMFNDRRSIDIDTAVEQLSNAWPCETPPQCSLDPDLYDIAKLTLNLESIFSNCYRNLELKEHLTRVQDILKIRYSHVSSAPTLRYMFIPSQSTLSCVSWLPTIDQLLTRPVPSFPTRSALIRSRTDAEGTQVEHVPLQHLITALEANAVNLFQRRYISSLRASADYLASERSFGNQGTMELPSVEVLEAYYTHCSASYIEALQEIKQSLNPRGQSEEALEQSGQWPRITAHALFQCIASNSTIILVDAWKRCLTRLVLLALELQRARRLLRLHLDNLGEELQSELENKGCEGWDSEAHPDWLLIQLQGNFLVRRVQAEVANEMIAPRLGTNTAMQLIMGEGKSSVILPIVVADLADGDQLVRVIVPKALTAQMFHLFVDRLGSLVNRRIYFVPFSRSLHIDRQKVATLREIMSECIQERGILIVTPDQVLSLRLVSVEKQLARGKDAELANLLLKLQRWLHSCSRDILDESDEILHVRYQLVYTIGLQQHVEGFPERWTTTEQVLNLVRKHASSLRELFPLGVEYERGRSGSFPYLRILHADAGQQLVSWIIQDAMDDLLPNFNLGQLRPGLRDAIRSFISCEHVPPENVQLIQEHAQKTPLWGGLLLLRGLLATGILLFAFRERRWRVDYGLALTRTMLAVPYRAKDVPAQRAEFGHPDVAIILTCLSYYYGGLNEEQLKLSFEILLKQDDPTLDYDIWIRDCSNIPGCLQTLKGVNVQSLEQWSKFLFPLFSRNQATINFYLSSVVFPKEAKEFPSKLSCSGWDLAERKERLLTGFSGTNDGQYLLPLHITQHDPNHQRGTNAKVLSHLLQPENKYYMCMSHKNGKRCTTHEFLRVLVAQKPEIRVLLDVGAQMLDLQNHELAGAWLDANQDALAAIYFSEDDELTVRTRDGITQLLLSSPFAEQLDQCVVYLDDAHTRGTDIKFPNGFRAAVTLGPKVTKDRLTQGCMRMRKLGHGHSIMFFAPVEVDWSIRAVAGKGTSDSIDTIDILHWAIRETWEEIQQRAPHWAQGGTDHASRYSAWTNFCRDQLSPKMLSEEWLQPEAKKLQDLYGPRNTSSSVITPPDILQRCAELEVSLLRDVTMDEEQEREVIHEVEHERQVGRPHKVPPASHSIHPDVIRFIETGIIPTSSNAFHPAFGTLNVTSAVTSEAHVWSPFVLTTTDFRETVVSTGKLDEYLRPVHWVVSAKKGGNEVLAILSPHEVDHLITRIKSSDHVHLHLYTPRVTKSMKPCDDLALYSIPTIPKRWMPPSLLVDQLNIFAGQLYLKNYDTYVRLCRFLCVYTKDPQGEELIDVDCDGFISPKNRPMSLLTMADTFQSSPINFLKTLISLRRKGMRFSLTHMGKLTDGRILSKDDFEGVDGETKDH